MDIYTNKIGLLIIDRVGEFELIIKTSTIFY